VRISCPPDFFTQFLKTFLVWPKDGGIAETRRFEVGQLQHLFEVIHSPQEENKK
jgi:hypothetical protein